MQKFSILGEQIVIPDEMERYMRYYKYMEMSEDEIKSTFKKWYKKKGGCEVVYEHHIEALQLIIDPVVEKGLTFCNELGIYSIDKKTMISKYLDTSFDEFSKVLDDMIVEYYEIESKQEDAAEYRRQRKENRGRMVGGGFGMSGAIKGAVEAGAFNAATGAMHSVGNAIGNMGSSFAAGVSMASLFSRYEDILCDAMLETVDTVKADILFAIEKLTDYRAVYTLEDGQPLLSVAEAIINNYREGRIPEEQKAKQFVNILKNSPEYREGYELIWKNYGDKDGELRRFGAFFGVSLDEFIKKSVNEFCDDIYMKYCQSYEESANPIKTAIKIEPQIKTALQKIKEYCAEQNVDTDWVSSIGKCEQLLNVIDGELCIFEGIKYSSREVATQVKADKKRLLDFLADKDINDNSVIDEAKTLDFESDNYKNNIEEILNDEVVKRDINQISNNLYYTIIKYFPHLSTAIGRIDFIGTDGVLEQKKLQICKYTGMPNEEIPLFLINYGSNGKAGILVTNRLLRIYGKGVFASENKQILYEDINDITCLGNNRYVVNCKNGQVNFETKSGLSLTQQNILCDLLNEVILIMKNISIQKRMLIENQPIEGIRDVYYTDYYDGNVYNSDYQENGKSQYDNEQAKCNAEYAYDADSYYESMYKEWYEKKKTVGIPIVLGVLKILVAVIFVICALGTRKYFVFILIAAIQTALSFTYFTSIRNGRKASYIINLVGDIISITVLAVVLMFFIYKQQNIISCAKSFWVNDYGLTVEEWLEDGFYNIDWYNVEAVDGSVVLDVSCIEQDESGKHRVDMRFAYENDDMFSIDEYSELSWVYIQYDGRILNDSEVYKLFGMTTDNYSEEEEPVNDEERFQTDIDIVKGMKYPESKFTYEEAFGNMFRDCLWSAYDGLAYTPDDNNNGEYDSVKNMTDIVEVTGHGYYMDNLVPMLFQFTYDKYGDYNVTYLEIDGIPQNSDMLNRLMNQICFPSIYSGDRERFDADIEKVKKIKCEDSNVTYEEALNYLSENGEWRAFDGEIYTPDEDYDGRSERVNVDDAVVFIGYIHYIDSGSESLQTIIEFIPDKNGNYYAYCMIVDGIVQDSNRLENFMGWLGDLEILYGDIGSQSHTEYNSEDVWTFPCGEYGKDNSDAHVVIEYLGDGVYSVDMEIFRLASFYDMVGREINSGAELLVEGTDPNGNYISFYFPAITNGELLIVVEETSWVYLSEGDMFISYEY